MMKKNEGTIDRALRIIAGLAVLIIGYFYQTWWGLIGLLPLLTGIVGVCPGYLPFGWSTCSTKENPKA